MNSQSKPTPNTVVLSHQSGINQAFDYFREFGFTDLFIYENLKNRQIGEGLYECYVDSGSDDYFYFQIQTLS